MRLLVAEDDPALLAVLARGLRQHGYVVDTASRGDDALDLLGTGEYAAAVLDWRMPGLDGVEVIVSIRRQQRTLPILLLTARDTPADRVTGLDSGADDYIVKPFDFGELLARLQGDVAPNSGRRSAVDARRRAPSSTPRPTRCAPPVNSSRSPLASTRFSRC